jgi:hypothetical protein
MDYTITITPTTISGGNYTVSASDTNSTYTYNFSLPFSTATLYGYINCGNNCGSNCLSGFGVTLSYTTSSNNYTINTGNYYSTTNNVSTFTPTSTCPAYLYISNGNDTTYNIIETYSYGSCSSSSSSSISFSLTGANGSYNSTNSTSTITNIETLSVTPTSTIPLSSTPNCSNFKQLTANPINGNTYTTTYTFNFTSTTISISIQNNYSNNSWTPSKITIECSTGYTDNQISISIATLCALFYSSSFYESNTNTTTCLNFISGIMLIAPIIQLFSLQ